MTDARPIEVAIVGGGCAAITTAFELTRPSHRGRYRVTVYQPGWRLGGKGASGRGVNDRIEEHGLHVWMGFYENAFRLMRECYAELDRDPATCRIASWRDAFFPDELTGLADRSPRGEWLHWTAQLPPAPGTPGDANTPPPQWDIPTYMARTAALVRTLLQAVQARAEGGRDPVEASGTAPGANVGFGSDSVAEMLVRAVRVGQLATFSGVIEAIRILEGILPDLSSHPENLVLRLIDSLGRGARDQLQMLVYDDAELRRLWEIIDLVLAVMRGIIRSGVMNDPRGFDALDDYDCREWLIMNGASPEATDSAFLRALYDLAFAYEDGDIKRPAIAAGQALRGALRAFFTYRGAFFWKMSSGMGDVVFAPYYEVLQRRGVRFEFFHRLRNVGLADAAGLDAGERPHVSSLEFDVQATVKGSGPYQPLVDVRGLPCWPARPDYDQLEDGERLRDEAVAFESPEENRVAGTRTLHVSRDFDFVVLGLGIGAIPDTCQEILARDPRWRAMVDRVKTVATQAFQLWLSDGTRSLGWSQGPVTLSGFVEPFDTWADMTHLVPEESWPRPPGAIAYFCSPLPTPGWPGSDRRAPLLDDAVRDSAAQFLDRDIRHLWPGAMRDASSFRWELLLDERGRPGDATSDASRIATQFWTANVHPSERYALSLPGSLRYRISPLDPTYDNLTVAGDWTDCGFNEGCVEAAVMSGRLAAHALSGEPALEDIHGFDHP